LVSLSMRADKPDVELVGTKLKKSELRKSTFSQLASGNC
jgi:hypothetical protein